MATMIIINTSATMMNMKDLVTDAIPATGTSVDARSTLKPKYVDAMEIIIPKTMLFTMETQMDMRSKLLKIPER